MKNVENAMQSPQLNGQEVTPVEESRPNNDRLPCNVEHEIFNENQFLKSLLQDDIAEGM